MKSLSCDIIMSEVINNNNTDDLGTETDVTHQKSLAMQEESMGPLREDLADWIAKTLEIDISSGNFMDVLDNGVYLCDLANVIHKKAEECVQEGKCTEEIPKVHLKCRRNAQSGSWFARDNSASFLKWCKSFKMQDDCLFESEDLVSHKSERQVIVTLLELARIGYKFGLEPPNIIKIEKELEQEEQQPEEAPPPKPKPPPSARSRPLNLDEEVRKMAAKCQCSEHVTRIREGKYMVFGKAVIIRLLKNRHLMVRVGGGWDTLEHYLIKHNPVFAVEHRRKSSIDYLEGEDVLEGKFLYIKSKYKT
ncbi:growth arrest-specific protein 2-like isoform X2 [Mercenaria mercenaria]|uniref:growth arrest-specific protein 2-like isoform X2 n=1 Tax=Mercenaria mercenaria TaxID=6596 RepID=UPI001E1DAA0E|nr:growth arrest-specific protein 2-like isoform X2 [Mercenaria mercenaria]